METIYKENYIQRSIYEEIQIRKGVYKKERVYNKNYI